jgi:hypothetical protein
MFQVLAFIIISVSNILIFTALRNQEQLMARYQGGGENQFSREAAVQGFLYSAAALNTVFWGFLSLFLGTFSDLNDGLRLFVAIMVSIVLCNSNLDLLFRFSHVLLRHLRLAECLHVSDTRFLHFPNISEAHLQESAKAQSRLWSVGGSSNRPV